MLAQAPGAALLKDERRDGGAVGQAGHNELVGARHGERQVQAAVGHAAKHRAAAPPQRQPILCPQRVAGMLNTPRRQSACAWNCMLPKAPQLAGNA